MKIICGLKGVFHVLDTHEGRPQELGLLVRSRSGSWVYIHHLLPALSEKYSLADLCGRIDQLGTEHPEITADGLLLDDPLDCACVDILIPLNSETPPFTQIESYAQIFV